MPAAYARVTQARAYVFAAVAAPEAMSGSPIGVIDFIAGDNGHVMVNGTFRGLSPGAHGFHVHQFGDLSQNCMAAGPHFNPHKKTHGAPEDAERHVGDLGNVHANANGFVAVQITDSLVSLEGVNSVLGRGLVIHEKPDDMGKGGNDESKKTGNAGKRLGCGVIGVKAERN